MSGWKNPPEEYTNQYNWFWSDCTKSITDNDVNFGNLFEVQQYIGPLETMYYYAGMSEGHYRIITKPPIQKIIATSENKTKILEFIHLIKVEILPRVAGLSYDDFNIVLPTLLEKLSHQTTLHLLRDWNWLDENGMHEVDLATVIEGIRNDSLMMSITFEYEYKYPPPVELLCATCMHPAIDPHVSPYFLGKVFCHSCTLFEGSNLFLKAKNLASMLDQLEVYCPFKSFGCKVCLPRGELGAHLQECQFVRVVCINKQHGCTFSAKSKVEAIEHMQSCQFSSTVCHELTENRISNLPSVPLPSHFPKLRDLINQNNNNDKNNNDNINNNNNNNNSIEKGTKCNRCCKVPKELELESEKDNLKVCCFHSGTWNGHTYNDIQEWRYLVWKQRLNSGLNTIIHFPVEVAKSTTALGVGILSFGALIAGAVAAAGTVLLPVEMAIAGGGLLWATPAPITNIIFSFLPSIMKYFVYTIPYEIMWGKQTNVQEPVAWTCCNRIGSNAEPCETRENHHDIDIHL